MSDDLVKRLMMRLQEIYDRPHDFSNGQKSEAAGLARDRIEELEAKLAKAVAFIDEVKEGPACRVSIPSWVGQKMNEARTTLAELTGGKP